MLAPVYAVFALVVQGVLIVAAFILAGAEADADLSRRLEVSRKCAHGLLLLASATAYLVEGGGVLRRAHSAHLALQLFNFPPEKASQFFLLGTVLAHVLGNYGEVTFLTYLAVDALFEALGGLLERHRRRVTSVGLFLQFCMMMRDLRARSADTSACVYMALFPYVAWEHLHHRLAS